MKSLALDCAAASGDPAFLREREWLVTDGLGGYASASVAGPLTRRHHGLFVPNLPEPRGRHVVIARLDELAAVDGATLNLGGAEHADGASSNDGARLLCGFHLDGNTPVWTWRLGARLIEKAIVMPHAQNSVCVRWRLLAGEPLALRLRLYASGRRQDLLADDDSAGRPQLLAGADPAQVPVADRLIVAGGAITARLRLDAADAAFIADPLSDHDVVYAADRERGYPHRETLHSPGYYQLTLATDRSASFHASTDADAPLGPDADTLLAAERHRLRHLVDLAGAGGDNFARQLVLAADQFVVMPGSRRDEARLADARGEDFRSIMAGYPWFNDWGRDTMISLEGLTLVTGRLREARAILLTFADYIRDGLVPNLFPEGGRAALYHTVDATLWYFHALDRYLAASDDLDALRAVYDRLESVLAHYLRGTRFGIAVDPHDGLVRAAADGYQLTWMDAKVDGWVVTPRRGKPVEIQALWFNALRLMEGWAARLGRDGRAHGDHAARAQASFNARYVRPDGASLFDVIDGPGGDDAALRPNQLFALSLRHPVLDERHWRPVLDTVTRELLTPVGLRTLARGHPDYKPHYRGSLFDRDAAYHQGTVWPWLLGAYVDALERVETREAGDASVRRDALIEGLRAHLLDAGIGSISEIFDAEAPHAPRGCIAQAWSVAEALRIRLRR